MNILITGGGGFQGSHLAEALLTDGHAVSILNTCSVRAEQNLSSVQGRVRVIWGSVTDKETVEKSVRGHDVVFHLAAHINVDESLKDPLVFFYANILGTCHVLEAVKAHGARLVLTSTCEVYGDGHQLAAGAGLTESAEMRPNSPYAASKAGADRMAYAYYRSYGLDVRIIRPFNIFGERQKSGSFGALIPIVTAKALRGEPLTIFGDGSATRDYSHVSDIIGAYRLALHRPELKGKAMNVASGKNTSVKDIVEYIGKALGVPVVYGPARPGEVSRFPADISLAKSLGYAPKIDIWEGIDRYLAWAKATHV